MAPSSTRWQPLEVDHSSSPPVVLLGGEPVPNGSDEGFLGPSPLLEVRTLPDSGESLVGELYRGPTGRPVLLLHLATSSNQIQVNVTLPWNCLGRLVTRPEAVEPPKVAAPPAPSIPDPPAAAVAPAVEPEAVPEAVEPEAVEPEAVPEP